MLDLYLFRMHKEHGSTRRPEVSLGLHMRAEATQPFDLLSPQLLLDFRKLPDDKQPGKYNYIYIKTLDRYYWIVDRVQSSGRWVITCQQDTLATWRDEIGAQTQYVVRAASNYNPDLADNLYPALSYASYVTNSVQSPWEVATQGYFVIGVIGGSGLTSYLSLTPGEFTAFVQYAFSDEFFNEIKGSGAGAAGLLKAQINPLQYLASVRWFPIFMAGGASQSIRLGWWSLPISGKVVEPFTTFSVRIPVSKHPQAETRGRYLNSAPYSSYILDVRPWGRFSLDSAAMRYSPHVNLDVRVDSVTGVGILEAKDAAGNRLLVSSAQVGVPIQVSQVVADYLGGVTSIAGGIATAVAGNYVGSVSGIINGITALAMPDTSTSGVNGGKASLPGTWDLIGRHLTIANEDREHLGRPFCSRVKLGNLSGYIKCEGANVDIPATVGELSDINTALNDGFYYE